MAVKVAARTDETDESARCDNIKYALKHLWSLPCQTFRWGGFLGLQLFCITDNEMLPWPLQSVVVWNWSMRPPPLFLTLIWCGALRCVMALHLEERLELLHGGLDKDVTRLYSLGVFLPSHHSCSLPPQVSICGGGGHWCLTCHGLEMYELWDRDLK